MKVDPGHGTEEESTLALLRGSLSSKKSAIVSGGVTAVQMVELSSWSRIGLVSTRLKTMIAEYRLVRLRVNY
jgi:hypothetical protein